MRYKCFELHTHTVHSDGSFTPQHLLESALAWQFDGIALTDHNTMSGLEAIDETLMARTLPVIPGIEWTTYFGHMLVLASNAYIDWRFALPHTIDDYIKKIKEAGGVVGIAHPFEVGSPFCTGCCWDFRIENWDQLDYIEVWSGTFPHKRFKNELALAWWTELLNKGARLAAVSGRDWHGLDQEEKVLSSATYLALENGIITAATVKEALARGRSFVTLGPCLDFRLKRNGMACGPGDSLTPGNCELEAGIDENQRRELWQDFGIKGKRAVLVHNGQELASFDCSHNKHPGHGFRHTSPCELAPGWARLELYGSCMGAEDTLLGFTSPVYIV
ncbi:MAG: CehA/McbA family metallohydrolase [Spirochaetaceae bacterium]|nr:CehA/McbA family metallohydrolase [Spirochaetaceae bacterium]